MAKYTAFGTTLEYESATDVWTAIDQIRGSAPLPGHRSELIDATTHDSEGGYMEYLGSPLKDSQEQQFTVLYDPVNVGHLYLRNNVGATENFRVTLTDTGETVHEFAAVILEAGPIETSHDGLLQTSYTLKRTAGETIT